MVFLGAQKERVYECFVRNDTGQSIFEITLPASTPASDFLVKVATHLNLDPYSFKLILQTLNDGFKIIFMKCIYTLEEYGRSNEPCNRLSFLMQTERTDVNEGAGEAPSACYPTLPAPLLAIEYSIVPSTSTRDPLPAYVGLVNQAMTCYLNSLLQALYMTPEFRNALYKWKYEGGNPSKCIPFQLQKLFLNLQTSSRSAVETTELTNSFGWGTGDVWLQHDVQELCRVMFDALEQVFKQTSQADLINQLYQGKMIDYVKCLECGREKSREDTFLDIPLPVRPFGSTVAYSSIEEALRAFVQPETLDGNNQYHCENCNKKCNAHKGLKFSQFPYLLTLHLKRFDFDYSTMHRIKLNDKVVFPELLDLSSFIMKGDTPMEEGVPEVKCDDSSTADSALDDDTSHTGTTVTFDNQQTDHNQEEDEGIEMSRGSVAASGSSSGSESDRLIEGVVPSGRKDCDTMEEMATNQEHISTLTHADHLYELYSIMIHSGSASGGHYYAYIKDFDSNQWFCFNDQSVTTVTREDIEKTYGGGPARSYYSGVYSSSTNAYMLMYRLIDKERNCAPISPEEFPPHIKKLVEEMKEGEEKARAQRAKQEEIIKVKVHWNGDKVGTSASNTTKLFLHQDFTLDDALRTAYKHLQAQIDVPIEQCRLVAYNATHDQMLYSFEEKGNETIGSIMNFLRQMSTSADFLLETRQLNQVFTPYRPNDVRIPVYNVRFDKEEVLSIDTVQLGVGVDVTVGVLRETLGKVIPSLGNTANLYLIVYELSVSHPFHMIVDDDESISMAFYNPSSAKLFVTDECNLDESQNYDFVKFLDKIKNIVMIHLTLPDVSEEILERLLIPPLSEQKTNGNNNKEAVITVEAVDGCMQEEEGIGCATTSDQSTSEDSSLTDSERTIMGEPVNEGQMSSPSDSEHQLSSPEPHPPNYQLEDYWDEEINIPGVSPNKELYLKINQYVSNGQRMLRVVVDRFIEWNVFTGALEQWVGVERRYLRLYGGGAGGEPVYKLSHLRDHQHLSVKLFRNLTPNEHKMKIVLFQPNTNQPFVVLTDWIVKKGQTIGENKKALIKYLEKRNLLEVPLNRCRLRKKSWKNAGGVLLDSDVWDSNLESVQEVLLEKLDSDEVVTSKNQILVFIRRWHPSTLKLGPIEQIVIDSNDQHLLLAKKISEMSEIPMKQLQVAKGPSQFPWEMSRMKIDTELKWASVTVFTTPNFHLNSEGMLILYRDGQEKMKRPNKEDLEEEAPTYRGSVMNTASPRREKPLRIYLDNKDTYTPTNNKDCYIPPPDYDC